jgi:hypothetical protein
VDLEEVWRIREEEVYPKLFGGEQRGIFPLEAMLFSERFKCHEVNPMWLTCGVIEFSPSPQRPFWLYITSAHSNPWDREPHEFDPEGISGSGVEFMFASSQQGNWAVGFLQNMLAYDILVRMGHFGDRQPFASGHRIPLNSPINGKADSVLRNAFVSVSDILPSEFTLPSGQVDLLTFIGATDREIAFARESGTDALIERLKAEGYYPITDPTRPSLI